MEKGWKGLSAPKIHGKVGLRASTTGEIVLDRKQSGKPLAANQLIQKKRFHQVARHAELVADAVAAHHVAREARDMMGVISTAAVPSFFMRPRRRPPAGLA